MEDSSKTNISEQESLRNITFEQGESDAILHLQHTILNQEIQELEEESAEISLKLSRKK